MCVGHGDFHLPLHHHHQHHEHDRLSRSHHAHQRSHDRDVLLGEKLLRFHVTKEHVHLQHLHAAHLKRLLHVEYVAHAFSRDHFAVNV